MRWTMVAAVAALAVTAGGADAQDAMFGTLAADTAQNIVNTQLRESMLGSAAGRRGGRTRR